jgi:hypothetical protein
MKKLILMVGILVSSISFGAVNPSLKNEIVEKVSPDLSTVELDEFHQDFVVVSFPIKDFQIYILDIQGSQEELIQIFQRELSDMFIKREYSEADVFYYKFIFKKA